MSGSTKYCHLLYPLSLPRRRGLSSHLMAVAPEHQRDLGEGLGVGVLAFMTSLGAAASEATFPAVLFL